MRNNLLLVVFTLLLVACSPEIILKSTPTSVETSRPTLKIRATMTPTKTITPTQEADDTLCIVTTGLDNGSVYMRSGPGKTFKVLRVLNEGEEVCLLDEMDGWFLIESNGDFGYIGSSLCIVERK